MAQIGSIVSVEWLAENIGQTGIRILDGTWKMPGVEEKLPGGYIPGALFFDVDEIAAPDTMAHMLPSAETFTHHVEKMGLKNSDHIVVYDRHGLKAAARVWWKFRMFGHDKISVLEGGLPAWIKAGQKISAEQSLDWEVSKYKIADPIAKVANLEDIVESLDKSPQILDARAKGRFEGTSPEPRKGLRPGRIPGSRNWPYSQLFDDTGHLKSKLDLEAQIRDLDVDIEKPIITTCGSGITAAVLALALHQLGAKDVTLYDGSWTEWGTSQAPIETGPINHG